MRSALYVLVLSLLAPAALAQVRPLPTQPPAADTPASDGPRGVQEVLEGDFETGPPSPAWVETSTNFGTPICSETLGNCGAFEGARTGQGWAWFGGTPVEEVATLSQQIVITPTDTTLSFYLWIRTAEIAGTFEVLVDSVSLFTVTDADAEAFPEYTPVTLDLRPFADDTTHTLLLSGHTIPPDSAGGVTSFWIDDLAFGAVAPVATEDLPTHHPRHAAIYPNPFTTTATVQLDVDTAQRVRVELFDLLGRRAATLYEGVLPPGRRTLPLDGAALPPGLYVVRMQGETFSETRTVVRAR